MSVGKAEAMATQGGDTVDIPMQTDPEGYDKIKFTQGFKYLGSQISDHGGCEANIQTCIDAARKAFWRLASSVWDRLEDEIGEYLLDVPPWMHAQETIEDCVIARLTLRSLVQKQVLDLTDAKLPAWRLLGKRPAERLQQPLPERAALPHVEPPTFTRIRILKSLNTDLGYTKRVTSPARCVIGCSLLQLL